MNEIKNHSTSPKHFVISNPTTAVVERAKQLTAGNWAKVQSNGAVVAHVNYRREFESLIANENRKNTIINVDLMDDDKVEQFAYEVFNKHAAAESFIQHAMLYAGLVNSRSRGNVVSNKAAEEFQSKIKAGITVAEMEAWLLR